MSDSRINPAWQAFNDLVNEGGEGYNPHAKWIAKAATAKAVVASTNNRMLRDQSGNLIPARKLIASMERDITRLASITDESARIITQAAIDHARSQLG